MVKAVRVVTWNIFGAVGSRLDEVGHALAALDADIVALQEIEARKKERRPLQRLQEITGLTPVAGAADFTDDGGWYGNALLSRRPLIAQDILDLSVEGRERRSALYAQLEARGLGGHLSVLVVHLGLRRFERARQAARLAEHLQEAPPGPLLLLGDLNEWRPVGTLAPLFRYLSFSPRMATFPSRVPLLPLDRVGTRQLRMRDFFVARPDRASRLSDHLPVVAELENIRAPRPRTGT